MSKAEKIYYDIKNGIRDFFKRLYYLLRNQRKIPVGNDGGIWMFDAECGHRFFSCCTEKQYRKIMAMQHWENNPVYALTGGVLVDSDDIERANPLGVYTETEWSYMCNVTDEERERNLIEQKNLFNFILNIFGNPNEVGACVIPGETFFYSKSDGRSEEVYNELIKAMEENGVQISDFRSGISIDSDNPLLNLIIRSNYHYVGHFMVYNKERTIAVEPTHHMELRIYADEKIKDSIEKMLSCSEILHTYRLTTDDI